MIETADGNPVQHIRLTDRLDNLLFENAWRLAIKVVPNDSRSKRHSLELQIEPNFVCLDPLLIGLPRHQAGIAGIGLGKGEQLGQRGWREDLDSQLLREPS